jgi:hypothetical protein
MACSSALFVERSALKAMIGLTGVVECYEVGEPPYMSVGEVVEPEQMSVSAPKNRALQQSLCDGCHVGTVS